MDIYFTLDCSWLNDIPKIYFLFFSCSVEGTIKGTITMWCHNVVPSCFSLTIICLPHWSQQTIQYLSLNSTSWIFVAFRSDASDVGVGGYSIDVSLPGRCIRRIQGNQYRKTILTWRSFHHDFKEITTENYMEMIWKRRIKFKLHFFLIYRRMGVGRYGK